ncbi:MAG TPA: DISARM system phospholipase D-like protein DrmC [Pseudonocardiaceae bacterium]|nr:DISARM system phospholipase D-like protein DrmC [Pseudonocardiaceae bacterium]
MGGELAAELADLAKRLSSAQIDAWSLVLNNALGPAESTAAALVDAQFGYGAPGAAHQLLTAWRTWAPRLPGSAIALALGAAAVAYEEAEQRRPRLVVSGPMTSAVAVRLTSSVVVEVIRAATDRVLLVSFAAYGVAEVGVRVDLVLERTVEQGGALRPDAGSTTFAALAGRAKVWYWPSTHRRSHGRAALHAKVVVADGELALLSSANLTDGGLSDNIEVGLLVRDHETAWTPRSPSRC